MLMIVGKNFRKFTTLTRNNYIIFSRKLFDGNIIYRAASNQQL